MKKTEELAKLIRYFILVSTTKAQSGHPTSSLSAADLLAVLFFEGFFRYNLPKPNDNNNDRLIFSKGHASPLFYSLWTVAGGISEEDLMSYRQFDSKLEGHPTMRFPFTEAPTGSLGQGLSIGEGLAISAKYLEGSSFKTFVLLGDSEMAEGSNWEAMQLASFYKLDNLIGILDVNRLGQRGETMYGYKIGEYEARIKAFGWRTIVIDGHDLNEISKAYKEALRVKDKPVMIIAKTVKGKGVSFLENKEGWHGKTLSKEQLKLALDELGYVDKSVRGMIKPPLKTQIKNEKLRNKIYSSNVKSLDYKADDMVATRKAYGNALVRFFPKYPEMVVLDAEVSNSTFSEIFKNRYPERFFEMFIAEQNMVGAAVGLSRRGYIPLISTFAAFFSRAHDQIRMAQYALSNVKFTGSHAGVSIGEDGASQMGLEDIGIFRSLLNNVVLYPSDAVSTEKLVEESLKHKGIVYIRTTRKEMPILYSSDENFPIGGSKVLKESREDVVTIVGAGITLHEALSAYNLLKKEGINSRVIDLYSIKPLDIATLAKALKDTKILITVEDHFYEGGLGEAVFSALSNHSGNIYHLAVGKMPKSGKPDELLEYEEINAGSIIKKVREVLK